MSWYHYNDYESVAQRRAKAQKKVEKLRNAGEQIEPIEAFKTRGIANTFWGKAWCRHLEQFSDYENRLPRGRSYVRHGSVCHLGIEPGEVRAMVSGSSMYELTIHIDELCPEKWSNIKNDCRGKIGSLIDLLQGKFPEEIMQIVTHPLDGLFPHPNEIRFNCNCPDWADMCKHIAAAMYGIGVRLDTQPELLFKLRGVNHEELITVDSAVDDLTAGTRSRRRRTLGSDAIGDVFGIDLDQELSNPAEEIPAPVPPPAPPTFKLTAKCVRALRDHLGLSRAEFARELDVSAPSISKWETTRETLKLHASSHKKLYALYKKTYST